MKYEIEIEGLPEGWRPVRIDRPRKGDYFLYANLDKPDYANDNSVRGRYLIVEKIKPRRIVLEETRMVRVANPGEWYEYGDGGVVSFRDINNTPTLDKFRIWREVKEDEGK